MNISKFTQKSIQAVQDLEKVAYEYGNQEVEQEHLLYALLTQEDSLILKLIEKMEINKDYFIDVVKKALDAKVKVSGGDLRFGQYLQCYRYPHRCWSYDTPSAEIYHWFPGAQKGEYLSLLLLGLSSGRFCNEYS